MSGVDTVNQRLVLDRQIRFSLRTDRDARVRKLEVITGSGVEDLFIEKLDAVEGSTIEMKYAVGCWVRNVHSRFSFKAHV